MKRLLFRFWASFAGYFALPCPVCREEFYGFQHKSCGSIQIDESRGKMMCPTCTRIAFPGLTDNPPSGKVPV